MKPVNEMHAAVITYFAAEKRESLLFMALGFAAIAVSVALWRIGSPYRGMGFPLAAIALIQIVVGGTVYFRTDAQVLGLHKQLAGDPAAFVAAELPRMETVRGASRSTSGSRSRCSSWGSRVSSSSAAGRRSTRSPSA